MGGKELAEVAFQLYNAGNGDLPAMPLAVNNRIRSLNSLKKRNRLILLLFQRQSTALNTIARSQTMGALRNRKRRCFIFMGVIEHNEAGEQIEGAPFPLYIGVPNISE